MSETQDGAAEAETGRSLRASRSSGKGTDQIRAEIHGNAARPDPSGAPEAVEGGTGTPVITAPC